LRILKSLCAYGIVVLAVKGQREHRRGICIMLFGVVKRNLFYALNVLKLVAKTLRRIVGNVVHHYLRRGIRHKLLVHYGKSYVRFGVVGKIVRYVVVYLYPAV